MRILVAGATGSIGIHVVNTAIAMGHQPVTLVRNRRKIKLLPRGTDIFYGDVSIPETLTEFDYNNDDEHRIVMLQGDRRHAGTPEDGVISREQIAQVLVTALSNDAAKNKTFELVAERGEAQQDLTPLFAELRNDNPQKNDGVFDIDNMPLTEEPECVINDLNLYSKNSKI